MLWSNLNCQNIVIFYYDNKVTLMFIQNSDSGTTWTRNANVNMVEATGKMHERLANSSYWDTEIVFNLAILKKNTISKVFSVCSILMYFFHYLIFSIFRFLIWINTILIAVTAFLSEWPLLLECVQNSGFWLIFLLIIWTWTEWKFESFTWRIITLPFLINYFDMHKIVFQK